MSGNAQQAEPLLKSLMAWDHAGIAEEASTLLERMSNAQVASPETVRDKLPAAE
jgi:hypothetical protein